MRKHQNVCPDCGAWLDSGESCDCQESAQEAAQQLSEAVKGLPAPDLLRLNAFAQQLAGNQQKAVDRR